MNTLSLNIEDLPGEQWEYVPGYNESYQVSNKGRIKSLIKNKPLIMRKTISQGQYKVQLYWKPGKFRNELTGRLVCSVFNGEPKENEIVQYKDGNPLNDVATNVYWSTHRERALRSPRRNKLSLAGSLNGMAKLTSGKVSQIKELKTSGKSTYLIAQKFGVSTRQVNRIINGRTWKSAQ